MDEGFVEIKNLIQKEKEVALIGFQKENFQAQLHQRIDQPVRRVFWLRRSVTAAAAVFLVMVSGWIAAHLFLSPRYERESKAFEKNIRMVIHLQAAWMDQNRKMIESQPAAELEWTIKRVLYAAQKERIPDEEISPIFSKVLHRMSSLNIQY